MFLYLLTFIRGFTRKKMPNLGTIVEVRTDETVNYCFFSFLPIYFCKQLMHLTVKMLFYRVQKYTPQIQLVINCYS